MRILIVEDDETSRRVLEISLLSRGHDVVGVATIAAAMDAARGVDFVVLDLSLPDSLLPPTTLGSAKALTDKVPVLILSGYVDVDVVRMAIDEVGCVGVVAKPVSVRDIGPLIEKLQDEWVIDHERRGAVRKALEDVGDAAKFEQ